MAGKTSPKGAKKEAVNKSSYSASDITVLEGLDPVRKRPGMYIGTTGTDGLHHLIWEVFDNGRDEAMGGFADRVEVVLLPGNRIRVADNGRGIPVDMHKQTKVSALETIMTTLHSGGKFGGGGYKVSGGLHGVGVSVVNALSTYVRADVYRDGGHFVQEYEIGKPKAKVKKIGSSDAHGTVVAFEPDISIFKEISFDWNRIVAHMRQQAYLVKGMHLSVIDARETSLPALENVFWFADLGIEAPSQTFYFEGGLRSLVAFHNQYQKPIHKNIFYIEKENVDPAVLSVEVALQYVDDISARITAFANNIHNAEHGTHVTGFKTALTRTLNTYARKNNYIKEKDESFTGEDVLEGITAVISIKMPEIQFEGQTKGKLGSVEARGAVETVFADAFATFLEENPDDAKAIANKVIIAVKARKAAKAAKDSVLRKGALEGMTLPGKLADCQTKSAEESELFIVEGDSAGGCFHGDTEVALLDGRSLSFKNLMKEHEAGKKNYCYTIDDGNVAVAEILHPRRTKQHAKIIRITLDSGEEIRCTPDHKFMMRDGSYREAKDLAVNDSLMPLYRKHSKMGGRITIDGYEMVLDPKSHHWIFTHLLSDAYNKERTVYARTYGDVIHHADFNKLNNNPSNLVPLGKQEHLSLHTRHLGKTLHREDVKEKCRKIKRTPEYREKARAKSLEKRELFSENAKKQWEDPEYKKYMGEKYLEFYYGNPEYRKETLARLDREQKAYWSDIKNRIMQAERTVAFFEKHPERRAELAKLANEEWKDEDLRAWRSETTKRQWTEDFRAQRKASYDETYLRKALALLHEIYQTEGVINYDRYDEIRKERNDKSVIRYQTICSRFFDGNQAQFEDAIVRYNHRVGDVEYLEERADVYDLEVAGTHNFALASGVFVHNSAKMGRDRRTQAILPLRGKILNVERARIDKMLDSEQIKNLVIALGTAIGDVFDLSKLRYHKIIIATDADVDGAHIRTLLLTLFYRHFRPIIDAGYLYIAQPPLYKIQKGKETLYAYNDAEKIAIVGDVAEEPTEETDETAEGEETPEAETETEAEETTTKKTAKIRIQRYKGLGEMNAEELGETTMNPEKRILKRVEITDAQEADKVFDILMGTDVGNRKSFIQSNAHMANLDI
jgi:DNA gyrase subunit B